MRTDLEQSLRELIGAARREGRGVLHELECHRFLVALGIPVPGHLLVREADDVDANDLSRLTGDRLVIKIVSPKILHRSDVGGVRVVANDPSRVRRAIVEMEQRFDCPSRVGFSIHEYVPHDRSPGSELLLGLRWTPDFGPVVTLGPGGIYTEWLARNGGVDSPVTILSPGQGVAADLEETLKERPIVKLITGQVRGQPPRVELSALAELLGRLLEFASEWMPHELRELEVNPLVLTAGGPVALDALARIGDPEIATEDADRPREKIDLLLKPRSIALIGVSRRLNPGRIILENILRDGFDRRKIYIVKPGCEELGDCRCVDSIASLPEPVDLLILCIEAAETPQIVEQVVEHRKAESIIVIPGGLGERQGTEPLARRVEQSLASARQTEWRGPLVNGGNSLGIRSLPGHYDTMFIPEYKIPRAGTHPSPLAVISQSGAFSIAKLSKLGSVDPSYVISVGNQIDLTVGDFLEHLARDSDLEVFACYVEGFRPLDGKRWLKAARKITASGRTVVLYRAGRTPQGAQASVTHTAAIAGDYEVTRQLAREAGVIVAETLSDFEDLIRLFVLLRDKRVSGWRLGAMSNAGFECVAFADSVGRFDLPTFSARGTERIEAIFSDCRLHRIVTVHNPLDVNPTMGDEPFVETARTMLDDDAIDVGIVGCVPMTGALQTLPEDSRHEEDFLQDHSVVRRLARLKEEHPKAWIAVVDGGPHYDAMAQFLEHAGIPTFRSADRAMRLFDCFCAARIAADKCLEQA